MDKNVVIHGDCLEMSELIEDGSIDLILTDLPYGTIKGLGGEIEKYKRLSKSEWDITIEPVKVFEIANRVLRKNGKMVLFSQEPYTRELINHALPNIPFSYRMIWEKDHFANCLMAKKAPVNFYEDILVFSKGYETESIHPLRIYAKKVHDFIKVDKGEICKALNMVKIRFLRYDDTQFSLCPQETYDELINVYKINEMEGFKEYEELKAEDTTYKQKYASVFNLWEGGKYKSNILKYKKDYEGLHPTQKPVLLLEDLIKTFSNENDVVLDLTAGSGTTAIAAIRTSRNYILIEKEKEYIDIINKRIEEHKKGEL